MILDNSTGAPELLAEKTNNGEMFISNSNGFQQLIDIAK
jgi:hypothetical protein